MAIASARNVSLTLLLAVASLLVFYDFHNADSKMGKAVEKMNEIKKEITPEICSASIQPLGQELKDCLLAEKADDLYKNLHIVTENCIAKNTKVKNSDFLQLHMGRFDEIKYFLPIPDAFKNDDLVPCYWLTIGVGGDTLVEKEMKTLYPKCKIFGVEPSPDQYLDFEKYGTIIPLAIGIKPGNLTMRLRKGTGYKNVIVPITPMFQVLDDHVGSRLVHFATLDIEGFEYPILDALKHGKPIESTGVRFCQIDVELHAEENQLQHMGANFTFTDYWRSFLANSPYLPLKSVKFLTHRKVTLVNMDDLICRRLFQFDKYF
uniref:Methyltransferase FkbM domain-containing protein n=1 Tax=Plectus sambesii TaxID=2011161 RepID=A0A914W3X3_9BILA